MLQSPNSLTRVEHVGGKLILDIFEFCYTATPRSQSPCIGFLIRNQLTDDTVVSVAELFQDVGSFIQTEPVLPHLIHQGKVEGYVREEVGTALPESLTISRSPGIPSVFELLCLTRMVEDSDEAIDLNPLCYIRGQAENLNVAFILLAIGIAVLAFIVPDKVLALNTKARAVCFLPVSRAASDDFFAAEKAEVGGTRRETDHMVATLRLEDLFLATGTLLIVSPFDQLLERIFFQHLLTMMGLRTADVAAALPANPASRAMTDRAANKSQSFSPQVRAANVPVNAAAPLAVHAGFHRHIVLLHLLSPRGQEVSVEQVPVRPEVQNHVAKHGWIVVLVLEGVVEPRRYAFFGAFVADSASVVPDPARQRLGLVLAADYALEIGFGHGGLVCLVCLSVGLGESGESPRLVEV